MPYVFHATLSVFIVCLFVLRLNVPVSNFSVMSGWSLRFLGLTSTVAGELMCIAQGHNTVPLVGTNPGPLDSESDALPLGHRASYQFSYHSAKFSAAKCSGHFRSTATAISVEHVFLMDSSDVNVLPTRQRSTTDNKINKKRHYENTPVQYTEIFFFS